MKKLNLMAGGIIVLSLMAACTNAPDSDKAKTTEAKEVTQNSAGVTYKMDASASKIEWIGTKVSGYHSGTIAIKSGELQVDEANITGGKFVMDMNTIIANGPKEVSDEMSAKLTGHLKSPDFFDVEKYPEAAFEITAVKLFSGIIKDSADMRQEKLNEYKVTDPTHTISGNLTIKGITKNIEFPARITFSDNGVEAKAKFNIDRKQWGLVYTGKSDDLIRDEINLGLYLKAVK